MNCFIKFAVFWILHSISLSNANEDYTEEFPKLNQKQYQSEVNAGNLADLFGTRQEFYPHKYKHLNRRFRTAQKHIDDGPKVIPKRALPDVVLAIAEEARKAQLDNDQPSNPTATSIRNLLRSGDYWNGVWKEDVDPESILRTNTKQTLGSVKVKIMPGSKLYDLVSVVKKISPRLLYVINKKD